MDSIPYQRKSVKKKIGEELIICIKVYEWIKNNTDLQDSYYHFVQEGKRGYMDASLLKRMGFKAGVCDIFISRSDVNKQYKGLWIEQKKLGGQLTPLQKAFIHKMLEDGYYATWSDSFDTTIELIQTFYGFKVSSTV